MGGALARVIQWFYVCVFFGANFLHCHFHYHCLLSACTEYDMITRYFCYVDDALLIYDSSHTDFI